MWLFRNAHFLYANRTAPELALETAIAALGVPYRAQMLFPGLGHIADFAIPSLNVIIEVDGKSHNEPVQIAKDYVHTIALVKRGWKVLRCTNEVALNFPEETVQKLLIQATHPQKSPSELLEEGVRLGLLDKDGKVCTKRVRRVKKKKRIQTTTLTGKLGA